MKGKYLFLSNNKDFGKEVKDTCEIHVLVVQGVVQAEPVVILKKLRPMLNEFKEITPEQLPHGLPLMQDI